MIYLIACPEPTLAISIARNSIKKDFPKRDEFNYVSFNMMDTPVLELAQEAEFLPLGYEKKAILAENCEFLCKPPKGKKSVVEGLEDLQAYLEHPADFTDLYMLVYSDKLDEKSPLVAAIKKNGKIQIEKAPDEAFMRRAMEGFLKKRGVTIEEAAAKELLKRCGSDYGRFSNELRKLEIYANGENIRLEAVQLLVSKKLEDNVFAISDALLANRVKKAFEIYTDLKVTNVDDVMLIGLLSTQFRFVDEVSYLDSKGRGKRDIAMMLEVPDWKVEKTLRSIYGVEREAISRILEQLYQTDKAILTGSVPSEYAFSRFLANFSLE